MMQSATSVSVLARLDARVKLACLVVFVVVALHAHTPASLGVCLAAACAVAVAVRLRLRDVRAVLRPLVPVLLITVVMQVLYVQQGDVLAWLGPVAITSDALFASVRMVASLVAIMVASVSFMRCTSAEELVRTLRWLLVPLRRFGVRTEAFILSLSIAFRFVPVLAGEFGQLKRAQQARLARFDGGVRARLSAYMRLFAPLVRSSFRRADRLAEAFLARSFACGIEPTALHVDRLGARDAVALALTLAIAAAVWVL